MPTLYTKEIISCQVPENFARQYGPKFPIYPFGDTKKIYEQLCALKLPDIEAVEKICPGWTRITCDECRADVGAVVQVGEEPNYESSTANICKECMTKAMSLF